MKGRLYRVLGTLLAAAFLVPSLVSADNPTFQTNVEGQAWLDAGNRPEPSAGGAPVQLDMIEGTTHLDASVLEAAGTDQLQPPIGGGGNLISFVGPTLTTRPAFLAVAQGLPAIRENFELPAPAGPGFEFLGASSICRAGACGSRQVIPGFAIYAGQITNPFTVGVNGVGIFGPGATFGSGSSAVFANAFADGSILQLTPPVAAFGGELHIDDTTASAGTVNVFSPTGVQLASFPVGPFLVGAGIGATAPNPNPGYIGVCAEGGLPLIGFVTYAATTGGVGNEAFDNITFGNPTAGPCAATGGINPNQQLGNQVHLPILNFQGQDDVCRSMIEVQYIGCDPSKAVLVTWGEPGFCPPQAAGPLKVECTGLLFPGSSWILQGAQIPTGSKGGMLFKFTAQQLGEVGLADDLGFDDVVADLMCETLFFGVVGDADDYRRFKKAYNEGLEFASIPQNVAMGEGFLAVEVLRHCPGDVTPGVEVSSKYIGIAGSHLGTYDPIFGGFGYYVPLIYANKAGLNTVIYIQNGGLECSSLEIWFKAQDDCLRARICDVGTLAPGETFQFDASDCVGPDWQGSAWVRASEPMGIVVDIFGRDIMMSYIGEPQPFEYALLDDEGLPVTEVSPSTGEKVAYGPLIYSEYQGWDTGVQVMNLDPVHNAKVKVYFLDRSGDIITTLVDWICPRGSQTFFLPVVADLPGTWVGSLRVESQDWWTPGSNAIEAPDIVGVATLMKYGDVARTETQQAIAYNLLPEHKAYVWQIGAGDGGTLSGVGLIAIPSLLKDLDGSGVTSETAIMNLVAKPGFTDFAIWIYDQNGLLDFVCEKLHSRQVEYIDLQTWGYVNNGFKGSAVISATFWEHDVFDPNGAFVRNLVGLGAVMVERTGTRLGEDIPGDEAAGDRGIPFATGALSFCPGGFIPRCPGQPLFVTITADFTAASTTVAAIPNTAGGTTPLVQTVTVSGLPADCLVNDVDLQINATHTWMDELDVSLTHAGVTSVMFDDICSSNVGYQQILDDDATTNVTACTSLTGAPTTRRKTESGTGLNAFDGTPANGAWTLTILDDFQTGNGSGTLNSWNVTGTCRYQRLTP